MCARLQRTDLWAAGVELLFFAVYRDRARSEIRNGNTTGTGYIVGPFHFQATPVSPQNTWSPPFVAPDPPT
eukprot:3426483-Prymnesium_polylepis.1